MKAALYHYTEQILLELKKNDLVPDMVQIGNEITNGLLWPDGQLPTYRNREKEQPHRDYQHMFSLLEQGIRAVRNAADQAKIILHLDYGGDNGLYREWFDAATDNGIDYDMIGLSYYPYWHGTLEDLEEICRILAGGIKKMFWWWKRLMDLRWKTGRGVLCCLRKNLQRRQNMRRLRRGKKSLSKN